MRLDVIVRGDAVLVKVERKRPIDHVIDAEGYEGVKRVFGSVCRLSKTPGEEGLEVINGLRGR